MAYKSKSKKKKKAENKVTVDKGRGRGGQYTVRNDEGKILGEYDSPNAAYKKEEKVENKKKK